MSETTSLNTELLSADARGRKHVPFAVFAVIVVHIVLFLVLLIAAGCRAKARAKKHLQPAPEMMAQKAPLPLLATAPLSTNVPAVATPLGIAPALIQPVIATEPPLEKSAPAPAPIRKAAQKVSPASTQRPTASQTRKAKVYIVKAGDTVEKIAKMHGTSVQALREENNLKKPLLKPGQQLRVSSQKPKISTEV